MVKPRSAIRVAAAKRPDMAAMGTPGPGCTLPPAVYRPGTLLRDEGRAKADIQPCVAWPYRAPPLPGNRRAKSCGSVRTTCCGEASISRPQRRISARLLVSHACISDELKE